MDVGGAADLRFGGIVGGVNWGQLLLEGKTDDGVINLDGKVKRRKEEKRKKKGKRKLLLFILTWEVATRLQPRDRLLRVESSVGAWR